MATLFLIPFGAFAQAEPPSDDVDDVPIDGGISLVAAAAIAYGAKKIRDNKRIQEK